MLYVPEVVRDPIGQDDEPTVEGFCVSSRLFLTNQWRDEFFLRFNDTKREIRTVLEDIIRKPRLVLRFRIDIHHAIIARENPI